MAEEEVSLRDLLAEKRHKEILQLLKLKNEGDAKADMELKASVEENTQQVKLLIYAIGNINFSTPELPTPNVTVNNDQKQLAESLNSMAQVIAKGMEENNKRLIKEPISYEFEIVRMQGGSIHKIIAKPKK